MTPIYIFPNRLQAESSYQLLLCKYYNSLVDSRERARGNRYNWRVSLLLRSLLAVYRLPLYTPLLFNRSRGKVYFMALCFLGGKLTRMVTQPFKSIPEQQQWDDSFRSSYGYILHICDFQGYLHMHLNVQVLRHVFWQILKM